VFWSVFVARDVILGCFHWYGKSEVPTSQCCVLSCFCCAWCDFGLFSLVCEVGSSDLPMLCFELFLLRVMWCWAVFTGMGSRKFRPPNVVFQAVFVARNVSLGCFRSFPFLYSVNFAFLDWLFFLLCFFLLLCLIHVHFRQFFTFSFCLSCVLPVLFWCFLDFAKILQFVFFSYRRCGCHKMRAHKRFLQWRQMRASQLHDDCSNLCSV